MRPCESPLLCSPGGVWPRSHAEGAASWCCALPRGSVSCALLHPEWQLEACPFLKPELNARCTWFTANRDFVVNSPRALREDIGWSLWRTPLAGPHAEMHSLVPCALEGFSFPGGPEQARCCSLLSSRTGPLPASKLHPATYLKAAVVWKATVPFVSHPANHHLLSFLEQNVEDFVLLFTCLPGPFCQWVS